jgi:predicted RNA-binding protein YlxR (DUF448 family)
MRVCAACRERQPAEKLIRFVRSGSGVSPDLARKAIGRGLNLSPSLRCLELAIKRGVFRRGLGVTEPLDVMVLRGQLVQAIGDEMERSVRMPIDSKRPAPIEEPPGESFSEWFNGFNSNDLLSEKLSERFAWLKACFSEFTFNSASDKTPSFTRGNV